MGPRPLVVAIGGPNGAGKSTIARSVLADAVGITEFVNADTIAAGLSAFDPARVSLSAGRVMLQRLHELAEARESFAFESTLASRTFAPWLSRLVESGYEVVVIYVWVRSAAIAVRRVRLRVRQGGHHIPEEDIRRRFSRSAANLLKLYLPLAERSGGSWRVYDNSGSGAAALVAHGGKGAPIVLDEAAFSRLKEVAGEAGSAAT